MTYEFFILLKRIISIIILLCIFLSITQCTTKSTSVVEESIDGTQRVIEIIPEKVQQTKIYQISFGSKSLEDYFWSVIVITTFLLPVFFSFSKIFSGQLSILKNLSQNLFSFWLAYLSYAFVFYSGDEILFFGYVLISCSIIFLLLSLFNWFLIERDVFSLEKLKR